jgi:hypothetical protein
VGNTSYRAGGINVDNGSAIIENSIVAGNFTEDLGGGIMVGGDGIYQIINSHIVGNEAVDKGAAIVGHFAQIEVTNTLVIENTGNTGIDDHGNGTVILLNYCDTYGNSPDGTYLTIIRNNCLGTPQEDGLDPMMAGGPLPEGVGPDYADQWLNYDYRLLPDSPAIDAGTPTGAPTTDIEGTPRDGTPDLGAYEGGATYPIIRSITPNTAFTNTGDLPVTILGFNFSTPISAQIDSVLLLTPTLVSSRTLSAVVPVNNLDVGVHDLIVISDGEIATLTEAFSVGFQGPWYVTPGGDDSDDCLSPATPCATINGALSKLGYLANSTVLVSAGIFTGTGSEVVLIDKSVTLSGGWDSGFTTQTDTSTLDGEGDRRGIYVNRNETVNINRFNIQDGYTEHGNGGGVYNSGTLTITNSTISNNWAEYYDYSGHGGGGIYNIGNLTLINSIVSNNTATDGGGGIYGTSGSSTVIINSQIFANTSINWEGGGVQIHQDSDFSMYRSWLVGNVALSNDGGGIGVNEGGTIYIENSIIAGNSTGGSGGGIWLSGGDIVNSHIVGNEANGDGAAIAGYDAQIDITNTLIIHNTGNTGIDSQWDSDAVFTLNYCDTYGNSPDGMDGVTITRNNCLGTPQEDGLDPLMAGGPLPSGVGPDYADEWMDYDYRLLPDSPAIDAGTPTGAPPTDIEGSPRDATPDIGAYEYRPLQYIYLPLVVR